MTEFNLQQHRILFITFVTYKLLYVRQALILIRTWRNLGNVNNRAEGTLGSNMTLNLIEFFLSFPRVPD